MHGTVCDARLTRHLREPKKGIRPPISSDEMMYVAVHAQVIYHLVVVAATVTNARLARRGRNVRVERSECPCGCYCGCWC